MLTPNRVTLKKFAYATIFLIPGALALWNRYAHKKPPPEFSGWGMTTNRVPPWKNETALSRDFLKANEELRKAVRDGRFHMTQYAGEKDKEAILRSLTWRHFLIFWSARYASNAKGGSLVECGVSDGLTAYFAMRADSSKKAYLYDAWEKMQDDDLLDTESQHSDYGYLTLERTNKNLVGFKADYIKGHIPDVFKKHPTPKDIVWLHIDLNASKPTRDSLEEMYKYIVPGGIVIFDDYAGRAFGDTRHAIDTFFADKDGILLPMPTGQAMFFKH